MQSVASTMPLMKFMQTINLSVFNQGAHYSMKFLLQLLLNLQLLWTFCTEVIARNSSNCLNAKFELSAPRFNTQQFNKWLRCYQILKILIAWLLKNDAIMLHLLIEEKFSIQLKHAISDKVKSANKPLPQFHSLILVK